MHLNEGLLHFYYSLSFESQRGEKVGCMIENISENIILVDKFQELKFKKKKIALKQFVR